MTTANREGLALAAFSLGMAMVHHLQGAGDVVDPTRLTQLLKDVREGRLTFYVSPGEVTESATRELAERTMAERIADETEAARLVIQAMETPGCGWS